MEHGVSAQEDRTFPSLYLLDPATYRLFSLADRCRYGSFLQKTCIVATLLTKPIDQVIKLIATPIFAFVEHFAHMKGFISGKDKAWFSFSFRVLTTPVWLPTKIALKILFRSVTSGVQIISNLFTSLYFLPQSLQKPEIPIREFFFDRNRIIREYAQKKIDVWNFLPAYSPQVENPKPVQVS